MNCQICFDFVDGIFRTSCGHVSCCNCFLNYVNVNCSYPVECFQCGLKIPDHEYIKLLRGDNLKRWQLIRKNWMDLSDKTLHKCLNPNCDGEIRHFETSKLTRFHCEKCNQTTCFKCKTTHKKGKNCKEWRRENRALFEERQTNERLLQSKIHAKNGMFCVCGLFLERDGGCFGMKCTRCKTELCFVTQKPRWGPKGKGDLSGGCGCTPLVKCHKKCIGCNIHEMNNGDYDGDDDSDDDDYDYDNGDEYHEYSSDDYWY